ncbi:MAG: RsmD family RNA methyltransferase [Bacteroidales bacterium]
MRIVSGKLKGRIIHPPKNFKVRPTTDMAKEALFNVLMHNYSLDNIRVLDLFGGTGNISYEFASRGAQQVTTIERNYQHFKYIQQTIKELHLEDTIEVKKADVFMWLKRATQAYDIVFADPPYDLPVLESLPQSILEAKILKQSGLLIIEHPVEYNFSGLKGFKEQRKYGKVNFSLFESYAEV